MVDIARKAAPELEGVRDGELFSMLGRWLFRKYSSRMLSRKLSAACGSRIIVHRITKAIMSTDILPLKIAMVSYAHGYGVTAINKVCRKAGICERDLKHVRSMDVGLCKVLKSIRYKGETPSKVKAEINAIFADIDGWTKRFAWKKLRFISMYQQVGMSIEDIIAELQCSVISPYLLQWPNMTSDLHKVNVMKRIMHNNGINLIKQYTRFKVSGTTSVAGTVNTRLVSTDVLAELEAPVANRDLILDIKNLVLRYTGKKRQLLYLLMGTYNSSFSAWLKQDNDEAFRKWSFGTYVKMCSKWLRVKLEAVHRFINSLRSHLLDYAI